MMKWKVCGRKRLGPNLRYYPGIYLEENYENLSQDSEAPGQDLNAGSPEYEAGVLIIRPRRSTFVCGAFGIHIKFMRKLIEGDGDDFCM
jgi:hypothetical protein